MILSPQKATETSLHCDFAIGSARQSFFLSAIPSSPHFNHASNDAVVAQPSFIVGGKQVFDVESLDHDIVEQIVPSVVGDRVSSLVKLLEMPPARDIEISGDDYIW